MKALIVEPDDSFRDLLKGTLGSFGLTVRAVRSASDAVERIDTEKFDLFCISMGLTDVDSSLLPLRIRQDSIAPILMLFEEPDPLSARNCLAAGVTELFSRDEFETFADYVLRLVDRAKNHQSDSGRILYLEDALPQAKITSRILVKAGYEVDHLVRAEGALDQFVAGDYDLVLSDILLDGEMTGTALLELIRQLEDPLKRSVPFIAISSFEDQARRLSLFRAGVNDYVTKPVLPEELLARVRNLIEVRNLMRRLADSYERMQKVAMTDQLSGLHNRHHLMTNVPDAIELSKKSGAPLSMLMLDIDHFKKINDGYGHSVGDDVLKEVGHLLTENVRSNDFAVRAGGEEFILVLVNCPLEQAIARGEHIRKAVEDQHPAGLKVTVSIGVAALKPEDNYDTLYNRADEAVYASKGSGRNQVQVAA